MFTNRENGKKRLKALGYNVEALFGNKAMAFSPETKKLLEKAKQMNKVGKPLQEIREQTGWFIGLGGNWKYAIDDTYARFIAKEEVSRFVRDDVAVPLKRVLVHEELDRYYPELAKKVKVKFYEGPKNIGGYILNRSNGTYTIRINTNFREEDLGRSLFHFPFGIRTVLLH